MRLAVTVLRTSRRGAETQRFSDLSAGFAAVRELTM